MGVPLDQLPAAARARALAALGEQETGRRRTTHLKGANDRTARYTCRSCPELEPFASMAAAERHADELGAGHARIALILNPPGD